MLSTLMMPLMVRLVPLFLLYRQLGWLDTPLPLFVPAFFGEAFFIFLMHQYYKNIPRDLVEAARIDGCSELRIWRSIMLPLSKPALISVAIFASSGPGTTSWRRSSSCSRTSARRCPSDSSR
jgi:ABC-type glycerol-3-phosphate transport system permease component